MFVPEFIAASNLRVIQMWSTHLGYTCIRARWNPAIDLDRLEDLAGVYRAEYFDILPKRDGYDVLSLSWKTPAPPTEYEIPPLVCTRHGVRFRTNALVMASTLGVGAKADMREIAEFAQLVDPARGNPAVLWAVRNLPRFPHLIREYATLSGQRWALEQLDMLTGLQPMRVRSRPHFRVGTILEVERLARP